jgi:hypothetical protein
VVTTSAHLSRKWALEKAQSNSQPGHLVLYIERQFALANLLQTQEDTRESESNGLPNSRKTRDVRPSSVSYVRLRYSVLQLKK